MFNKIKEAFFGKPKPLKVPEINDPALGRLVLNDEVDWWEAKVQKDGDTVGFGIGGRQTPDPALIRHAVDILNDYSHFKAMVADFLKAETVHFKEYEEEIERLTIDDVCLCWPERPNDGMIYFNGPDDCRVWRCDYVSRKPKGLGFDD